MKCYYSVRLVVPAAIEEEWRQWMLREHIPALAGLPWFSGAHLYKIESPAHDAVEYIVMYEPNSMEALDTYFKSDECTQLRAEFTQRYGNNVTISREIWLEQ